MKYLLVGINAKYIHSNLALYSLKEYAKEQTGVNVDIAEYTINMPTADILRRICEHDADFIGISTYIWNVGIVYDIIRDIKKIKPTVFLALGGPEVTYNSLELMRLYPALDCIMQGEGEATFAEIISNLESGNRTLKGIPGTVCRRDGEIIANVPRAPLDMSSIPFPYQSLEDFENRIIYYESSRGCPFGCAYCLSSVDKSMRFRDLNLVFGELSFFLRNNVKQVKFVDRTFNANPGRTVRLLEFIRDNDNGITNFHFEIAGDILTDSEIEIINSMRPGLIQLEIGVQTTNDKTLGAINRQTDMMRLTSNTSRLIAPGNVHVHLDLIAGLPYEDYASFRNSFNDVYAMNGHELQLGFLKMLKGAPINELTEDQQISCSETAPYEVFSTKYISYEEIVKLKALEEMLEIYHNSLQFTESEKFLLEYEETPFDFYLNLANFYRQRGYLCIESKRARRYEILLEYFTVKHGSDQGGANRLRLLLTLDYYKREKAKSRPDFAPDISSEFRKINDFVALHPEYRQGQIHIEPLPEGEGYAIFDYSKRSPVTGNTEYIII